MTVLQDDVYGDVTEEVMYMREGETEWGKKGVKSEEREKACYEWVDKRCMVMDVMEGSSGVPGEGASH